MYCGHSYHEKCLRIWRLYQYRCCPCSYEAIKEIEEKIDEFNNHYGVSLEELCWLYQQR